MTRLLPHNLRHPKAAAPFDPAWTQEQRDAWAADGAQRYREARRDGGNNGSGRRERDEAAAYSPPGELIRVANREASKHSLNGSALAYEVGNPDKPKPVVSLRNGASITPTPQNWLWPEYIAAGKLHLIGGQPGTGKTTIALWILAIVTRGGAFPDGARCANAMDVVIWSGEDDPADTLAPRLIAAGADMKRVHFVEGVIEDGKARDFDPAKDIEPLREAIAAVGKVGVVLIDPIVSAVQGDSHKNTEVRRALQPLVTLCSDEGAALIGVTHFTKGTSGREPIERINGSIAFGALARVVFVAAKKVDQDDGSDEAQPARLFARAKSNIGPDGGGFSYELRQIELADYEGVSASFVQWGAALDGSARELLADAEAGGEEGGDERREASSFLRQILADGPVATTEIKAAAVGHAIAWRTVERAKRALGVEATRTGERGVKGGGRWSWRLTPQPQKSGGLDGVNPPASSRPPGDGGINDEGEEL